MFSNNLDAFFAAFAMITALAGGYYGGKRAERNTTVTHAANTITILSEEVEVLKRQVTARDEQISEMLGRIHTMEEMITQRADVEGVKVILTKIAEKVGV